MSREPIRDFTKPDPRLPIDQQIQGIKDAIDHLKVCLKAGAAAQEKLLLVGIIQLETPKILDQIQDQLSNHQQILRSLLDNPAARTFIPIPTTDYQAFIDECAPD